MYDLTDQEHIEARFLENAKKITDLYKERNKLKANYQDIPVLLDYQANLVEIGHKLVKQKYFARELWVFYDNKANSEYTEGMIQAEQDKKQSTYAKAHATKMANDSRVLANKWESNFKKFRDMIRAIENDQISIHSRYKYLMGTAE